MVKKVNSMEELAALLNAKGVVARTTMQQAIAASAVMVQSTAKLKFGTYQPGVGPYPAWEELRPATVAEKEKAGGGEDPLIGHYLQSHDGRPGGQLRASIVVQVGELEARVGTNDPIAPHHEYGAPKKNIPPRPYLRPALYENQPKIIRALGEALAKALEE